MSDPSLGQLSWLFSKTPPHFERGHTKLYSLGFNRYSTYINKAIATLNTSVWKRIIWPRIIKTFLLRFTPLFLHELDKKEKMSLANKKAFIKHLKTQLMAISSEKAITMSVIDLVQQFLHHTHMLIKHYYHSNDLFAELKESHNQACLTLLREIQEPISSHPHGMDYLIYLLVRANWLDVTYIHHRPFLMGFYDETQQLLNDTNYFKTLLEQNIAFDLSRFKEHLFSTSAKRILYECDNAGEAVFDLFFIQHLLPLGHHITIVAKKTPVLNDITVEDLNHLICDPLFKALKQAKDNQLVHIIYASEQGVGKNPYQVSQDYKHAYRHCDLLILKGQAHFECMPAGYYKRRSWQAYPYKKPIFYLMGIKDSLLANGLRFIKKKPAQTWLEQRMLYGLATTK